MRLKRPWLRGRARAVLRADASRGSRIAQASDPDGVSAAFGVLDHMIDNIEAVAVEQLAILSPIET